jgi:hypothetical protein
MVRRDVRRIWSWLVRRRRVRLILLLSIGALALSASLAVSARAAAAGGACVDKVVADLREGKLEAVANLLVEPPSYDEVKASQDHEGSVAGLRAILETVGAIEDVKPMAGPRRFFRVQISGGTPEAWANVGRPMVTEVVERDVRFSNAGRGVLILKRAKGAQECSLASLDLGLDVEPAEAREKMIAVYIAVMEAVGITGAPDEMRKQAESMLTTYDAGTGK